MLGAIRRTLALIEGLLASALVLVRLEAAAKQIRFSPKAFRAYLSGELTEQYDPSCQ